MKFIKNLFNKKYKTIDLNEDEYKINICYDSTHSIPPLINCILYIDNFGIYIKYSEYVIASICWYRISRWKFYDRYIIFYIQNDENDDLEILKIYTENKKNSIDILNLVYEITHTLARNKQLDI